MTKHQKAWLALWLAWALYGAAMLVRYEVL